MASKSVNMWKKLSDTVKTKMNATMSKQEKIATMYIHEKNMKILF